MKNITVIMTTYNNNDYTRSSVWSFRNFFPEVRIILTDGGSRDENMPELKNISKEFNTELMILYGAPTEYCRNAAASIVDTEYILFMDNDTKILHQDAVNICLDVLDKNKNAAQTGAYGIKIIDRAKKLAYVGIEFTGIAPITGFSAYFSMHRTEYYRLVNGMKINEYIYDVPKKYWEDKMQPGYSGDFNIGNYYIEKGFTNLTPPRKLPILHWGQAHFKTYTNSFGDWWYDSCNHIRCNPLNEWEKFERERNK